MEASLGFLERGDAAGSDGEGEEGAGQDARVEALLARARSGKALRRPLTAQERRERVAQLLEARRGGGGDGAAATAESTVMSESGPALDPPPSAGAAVSASAGRPQQGSPARAPPGRRGRPHSAAASPSPSSASGLQRTTSGGRHSKEAAAAKAEEALREEATFRPKITARTKYLAQKNRRRAGTPSGGGVPDEQGASSSQREAWLQDLAKPRTDVYLQLERRRFDQEAQEVSKFSFRPEIHTGPKDRTNSRDAKRAATGRVRERLANAGLDPQTEARLNRLRAEGEAREMAECTFKPRVSSSARTGPNPAQYVPIHRRVGRELKERNQRLIQARIARELDDPNLTFQPQLNESSIRIAEAKELEEELLFTARLEAGVGGAPSGGRSCRGVHVTEDEVECTFKPVISKESERMVTDMSDRDSDFIHRQRLEQQRRAEARAGIVHADEAECTFRPVLEAAGAAVHVAEEKRYETLEERINRLAVKDVQSFEARKKELEAEFYKDCTFKPSTLAKGKKADRAPLQGSQALEELHRNSRAKKSREKSARQAEERFKSMHTFKPKTMSRGGRPASAGRGRGASAEGAGDEVVPSARLQISGLDSDLVMGRIKLYREERERKLKEHEEALAIQELEQCTFKPRTNKQRVKLVDQKGPSLKKMPGMANFLQKKERAQQQQEEKRKIEEKIFLKDTSKLGRKVTCTEAKPFRLSNGVGSAQKRESLRRRILEEERAQCTFHPVTNESKNREIIQRILMAEDSFHSDQGRE